MCVDCLTPHLDTPHRHYRAGLFRLRPRQATLHPGGTACSCSRSHPAELLPLLSQPLTAQLNWWQVACHTLYVQHGWFALATAGPKHCTQLHLKSTCFYGCFQQLLVHAW